MKFYFACWGNDFNLKIKASNSHCVSPQALTLAWLLGFSGNNAVLGVPKSGYVLHLEESSVYVPFRDKSESAAAEALGSTCRSGHLI